MQPDPALKPRDAGTIPAPPTQAKAVYCNRESITTDVGDERIIELGLPLVVRSGGREGALEYPPNVVFNYHPADDKYLPGKSKN